MKDGTGGDILDTVTLVDVTDGDDAVVGSIESDNGLAWVRNGSDGDWSPITTESTLTVNYYQAGVLLKTRTVVVTRSGTNLSAPAPDTVEGITYTLEPEGGGTPVLTVQFEHLASGIKVAETLYAVQDGLVYNALLTNESHVVACDVTGVPNSGELGSSGRAISDVLAYLGTAELTAVGGTPGAGQFKISVLGEGCSVMRSTSNYETFYLTAMADDTAKVTVSINLENVITWERIMTLTKAYDTQTLSADFPLPSGLVWTGNNPDTNSVSWGVFTILYKGLFYEISAGNSSKKYLYWDQAVGTSLSGTDTFSEAVGTNKWLLGENDAGIMFEVAASKYILAGYLRVNTLAAISAVLGDLEIRNTGDGKITITDMNGEESKELRINEDGVYSTIDGGTTWSKVIGINDDGVISLAFDAWNPGSSITQIATLEVGGKSTAVSVTPNQTYVSGMYINNTSYPSINWSTASTHQVMISEPLTLLHVGQYVYFDTNDINAVQVAPYMKGSSLNLFDWDGRVGYKTFVMRYIGPNPSNVSTTYNYSGVSGTHMSRSDDITRDNPDRWEDLTSLSSANDRIRDIDGNINVGDLYKVGIVFKKETWNESRPGTYGGVIKVDATEVGTSIVRT